MTDCKNGEYINFQLGKQLYATELNHVVDVMQLTKLTKIPMTSSEISGFFVKDNQQVIAVDLGLLLGLQMFDSAEKVVVVLTYQQEYYGLSVDSVQDIGNIQHSAKLLATDDILKKIQLLVNIN